MRVALIGDVHANLPALEAVLNHAQGERAEALWNVGDFVGYGAFPNQVIERLRRENAVSIAGNYDLKVLKFKKKRKKWRRKKRLEKFLAFQWADHVLTPENRQHLSSLPLQRTLRAGGSNILLTHGSPASKDEHLTSGTPERRLRELASTVEAKLVICGHSHEPFVQEVDSVIFINTGSVGRPDDGDSRACYALLELGRAGGPGPQVHHHRVAYDVGRAVKAIRDRGLPEAFAQMMIQGYALDTMMEAPEAWDAATQEALPWSHGERERRLKAVLKLAERCDYEASHTQHVTYLALRLFDELEPLHRLGPEERFWLRCGSLLHDIGWIEGQQAHHKTSLRLILNELDASFAERLVTGSIARYHRGPLPKDKHDHFSALSPADQYRVSILAALLRVADGLDRTHRRVVEDLWCEIEARRIVVTCNVRMYPIPEREAAKRKGDLLESVFQRELLVRWHSPIG